METPNTAYYIPNLVRNDDQADVTIEVVPVNARKRLQMVRHE